MSVSCPQGNATSIRYTGSSPWYTLVGETVVNAPTGEELVRVQDLSYWKVEANDVIAVQTTGALPVKCQPSSSSSWSSNYLTHSSNGWTAIGQNVTLTDTPVWTDGVVCDLRVKYSKVNVVNPPNSLTRNLENLGPGSVTYEAAMRNKVTTVSDSAVVILLYPVLHITLVYPPISLPAGSTNSMGTVPVEAGVDQTFLFMLQEGTNVTGLWSLSQNSVQFSSSCPSEFQSLPECISSSSLNSFATHSFTFDIAHNFTGLPVDALAANPLNSETIEFEVLAMEVVTQASLSSTINTDIAQVNTGFTFTARVATGTHETYTWQIDNQTVSVPNFTHTFTRPDVYPVVLTVSNAISSDSANRTVLIYTLSNARNLSVNISPLVGTGLDVPVTLELSLDYMSTVEVTFSYSDTAVTTTIEYDHLSLDPLAEIPTSHIFTSEGTHKVQATVRDKIDDSLYTAEAIVKTIQSINSVTVSADPTAVEINSPVTLTATKDGGTGNMWYSWDFGDQTGYTVIDNKVQHNYTAIGVYNATVSVSNNASTVSDTQIIQVCEAIIGLTLTCDRVTTLGSDTSISASVSNGSHLDFQYHLGEANSQWLLDEGASLQHNYAQTGVYNVSVIVSNPLGEESTSYTIYVIDNSSLYVIGLENDSCAEAGELTTFAADVIHMDPDSLYYEWAMGDGMGKFTGTGERVVTHTYQTPGTYPMFISAQDTGGNPDSVQVPLCVQQRVGQVNIIHNGPLTLPRQGSVRAQLQATVGEGTDYSYTWVYGLTTLTETTGNYSVIISSLGSHLISVTVCNELNSETVATTIVVQEAVQDLDFVVVNGDSSSSYLATNTQYTMEASCGEGSDIVYRWNILSNVILGSEVNYTFVQEGIVTVLVTADNDVSGEEKGKNFTIINAIASVTIGANQTTVPVGDSVHFTATTTGNIGEFVWQICDRSSSQTCTSVDSGMVDSMTHQFLTGGIFDVTVHASNPVSNVTDQVTISVVEEIEGLAIVVYNLTNGQYTATDTSILFVSNSTKGGAMTSNWTITDVQTSVPIHVYSGPEMDYTFTSDGQYEITLQAYNDLGVSTVRRTIEAVVPVGDISIGVDSSAVPVNESIILTGEAATGSNLTYQWFLQLADKSNSPIGDGSSQVTHVFPDVGSYVVWFMVSNPIMSKLANQTMTVHVVIDTVGVNIDYPHEPYLETQKQIEFTAVVHPPVSTATYSWTFINDYTTAVFQELTGQRVLLAFDSPHVYIYTLNVSNVLGYRDFSDRVILQEKISGVDLSPKQPTTTVGDDLILSVSTATGTNMSYIWEFGDNPGVYEYGLSSQLSHSFSAGGIFPVTVMAVNDISNDSDTVNVSVSQEIRGLRIANCCAEVVPQDLPLTFTAEIDEGAFVEYEWIFQHVVHSSRQLRRTGKEISIVFPLSGMWHISLNASNDLGSEGVADDVLVQQVISALAIGMEPDGPYMGEPITFQAITGGGSDISYQWSISSMRGVVLLSNDTTSQQVTLKFTRSGRFEVSVQASNNVSSQQATVPVSVNRLVCKAPVVTIVGETDRRELRSRAINIDAIVKLTCTQYVYKHKWTIYNGQCWTKPTVEIKLSPDIVTNTPNIFMPARTLQYGHYCIHFTSKYDRVPGSTTVSLDFEVTVSPLQAIISGGNERTVAVDYPITLDGTLSFDPDLERDEEAHLTYNWECDTPVSYIIDS